MERGISLFNSPSLASVFAIADHSADLCTALVAYLASLVLPTQRVAKIGNIPAVLCPAKHPWLSNPGPHS